MFAGLFIIALAQYTFLLVPVDSMMLSFTNQMEKGILFDWVDDASIWEIKYRVMTYWHIVFVASVVFAFVGTPFLLRLFAQVESDQISTRV